MEKDVPRRGILRWAGVGILSFAGCLRLSKNSDRTDDTDRSDDTTEKNASDNSAISGDKDTTTLADADGDGVADSEDEFPNDSTRSKDRDDDGVADSEDAFPEDSSLSKDSDGDNVANKNDDYPYDSNRSQQIETLNDMRKIPEDEWYYWTFDFTESTTIDYSFTVRSGPAIDAIVMDKSEYRSFKNGDRSRYYTGASSLESTGDDLQSTLDSGSYVLILDNSELGKATPPTDFDDNIAEVKIEFEAYR